MPVISMFYGIIVMMYYLDNKKHKLPHIHVKYNDLEAVLRSQKVRLLKVIYPIIKGNW
jgi:hypothetical protein